MADTPARKPRRRTTPEAQRLPDPKTPVELARHQASRGVASMRPGARGFDRFADDVTLILAHRGIGTADLSRASGVARETLAFWLTGRRPLRGDYMLAVMDALGLEIRPIADGREPAPARP